MTIMPSSQFKKSLQGLRSSRELFLLLAHQIGKIVTPAQTTCTMPPLHDFISILVHRSRTRTGTLLVALILLTRLSQRLGHVTTGMATAPQRILLASLIISTKLIHDTSPKNKYWKEFANHYFELNEINLMEKQFLTLMDFNLSISNTDFQNAVDYYGRCSSKKIKAWWWQETPDCLVGAPGQNVEALTVKKNVMKASLPPLSSPSPTSASSSSSLQSVSLSSTPTLNRLSNCISSGYSHLESLHVNGTACDVVRSSWPLPTTFVTPLFSV